MVGRIALAGLAVLALLAWALNGQGDPEVWASAFWCSALVNYGLALALADARQDRGR